MFDVITLVAEASGTDEYGDPSNTTTQLTRYAKVESIGRSEFYQADASGLKPEIKFILNDFRDYNGQRTIIYDGGTYRVLRTYQKGKKLEIVCYGRVNNQ
jgi:SPP1 family predicted phage head-tail adaptor